LVGIKESIKEGEIFSRWLSFLPAPILITASNSCARGRVDKNNVI
jgi:hypothetical protein